MNEVDQEYYSLRAEEEIKLANRANNLQARRSHSLLAGYYLDRLHNNDREIRAARTALARSQATVIEPSLAKGQEMAFDADRVTSNDDPRSRVLNINLFRN